MKLRWINNTKGRPDAMLSLALVGFVVATARFLLGGVDITFAGHAIKVAASDAASIAAILTPTLGAYVARRHSETKYGVDGKQTSPPNDDDEPPRHGSSQG